MFYFLGECMLYNNVVLCGFFVGFDIVIDFKVLIVFVMEGVVYVLCDNLEVLKVMGIELFLVLVFGGGVWLCYWFEIIVIFFDMLF